MLAILFPYSNYNAKPVPVGTALHLIGQIRFSDAPQSGRWSHEGAGAILVFRSRVGAQVERYSTQQSVVHHHIIEVGEKASREGSKKGLIAA